MRVERSLVIGSSGCFSFLAYYSKFIQGAKLVKAHLVRLSVPAGTTPFESAASLSSTKRSERRRREIEGVATPAGWAWSY